VQFGPGVLQLEIGIQSFNPEVQQRIARRQDNAVTVANLRWLVEHTHAHLHTDLIFGLPGETWQSFANGFDQLCALRPHEIQLGVLKRLRGTPLAQRSLPGQSAEFGMSYATQPPYTVLQTDAVDAETVQTFVRLARYWDLVANAGRFPQTLQALLAGDSAFMAFADFARWMWDTTASTQGFTPEALTDLLARYLLERRSQPAQAVLPMLLADYLGSGAHGSPASLRALLPRRAPANALPTAGRHDRQRRHLALTAQDAAQILPR